MVHAVLREVANNIVIRSRGLRDEYLEMIEVQKGTKKTVRANCGGCANLAHAYGAAPDGDKEQLVLAEVPNIGIASAATDMLTAHQVFYRFPDIIKDEARKNNAVAQIIGQVTAMCDGTTQGRPGMDLSLLSRDVIAQSLIVGESHDVSDAILALGTCDKIKPGMVMGLSDFGHLPTMFAPGGPMTTGQSNGDKKAVRMVRAEEIAGLKKETIGFTGELESELKSYHGPGTCTFYGTANGNEVVAEFMGLQLPGSSFVNPHEPLRDILTRAATQKLAKGEVPPLYQMLDEKAFMNGIVAMLATGGSTNLTLHVPAMARSFGLDITWADISKLSDIVPSVAKIYPNGPADINQFQQAGGTAVVARNLLDAGVLFEDVKTVAGGDNGIHAYTQVPVQDGDSIQWVDGPTKSQDRKIISLPNKPFAADGGTKVLNGRLGQAICKTSAVEADKREIRAPARIFNTQDELHDAYNAGDLTGNFVAVVRGQGPHQNGMPELHKLLTPLANLEKNGQKVALLTNGRLSGASGGTLTAIHLSSAAPYNEEPINKIREGDIVIINADTGVVDVNVPDDEWNTRTADVIDTSATDSTFGRRSFAQNRQIIGRAHYGASFIRP